jgi:16S rRNA (cytosine1402-N4)-methyltransferase
MKARLIAEQKYGKINGLLLDLGVSSKQLDSTAIGLSYRVDSDLDMRFGSEGKTAKELLNESDEDELLFILRSYGEEPNARAIARRIIERRRLDAMETTFDLRSAVEEVTPEKFRTKALSRVFQAVRIAVNDELDVLQKTLIDIIPILVPGGRIVVMSYHSLEDRIVKDTFKEYSSKENPQLKILTKKPIIADEEEMKRNPRSRSVKIRVAEKT